jgi:hypothetical protein
MLFLTSIIIVLANDNWLISDLKLFTWTITNMSFIIFSPYPICFVQNIFLIWFLVAIVFVHVFFCCSFAMLTCWRLESFTLRRKDASLCLSILAIPCWNLEFEFESIATQIFQFKELHFHLDFPSMNDLSHWSAQRAQVGIPFLDASSQQALTYTMFQKWIRHKLFIMKIHPTTR